MQSNGSSILLHLLVALVVASETASAFQTELLNQALQMLDATTSTPAPYELLFVAANVLDASSSQVSQQQQPQRRPPFLFFSPPPSSSEMKKRLSLSVPFPLSLRQSPNDVSTARYNSLLYDDAVSTSNRLLYDYDAQPISGTLSLTTDEERLFRLVQDCRDVHCPGTTIRVGGGWVRDKLLREPTSSRDIDFVLSDVEGVEFAEWFRDYVEAEAVEENGIVGSGGSDGGSSQSKSGGNGGGDDDAFRRRRRGEKNNNNVKLKQSPRGTRSEHLRTASLTVGPFEIDFNRLRYEKYTNTNSRVPEKTGVASVVEDAWRRDLTINSLFYNVNTNQVEDWTERGLQDLQLRNIATPRPPLPTLLDDPLRILRAMRFAAQLSFTMDPALFRAASDPRVRTALRSKVSTDNIGNEIDVLFQTRDPTRGVKLLLATGLVDVVFPLFRDDGAAESSVVVEEEGEATTAAAAAATAAAALSQFSIYYAGLLLLSRTQALASRVFTQGSEWDGSKRRFLWYASFFKALHDVPSSFRSKRDKRHGSAFLKLLADGLKRPKSDIQSIEGVIKGTGAIRALLEGEDVVAAVQVALESEVPFREVSQQDPRWKDMSDLRWRCYKVLKPIGNLWKEALMLSLASPHYNLSECARMYAEWVTLIEDRLGLGDVLLEKDRMTPLLNGSQIQSRLAGVRGEGFRRIMEAQEEWQVRYCRHRDTTGDHRDVCKNLEAELIDYLIERFPEHATEE